MFWMLLGTVEDEKILVEDPAFSLTSTFGRIFMIAHVVCTVIVALNMLIAMMNNSFEKIMVSFLPCIQIVIVLSLNKNLLSVLLQ